MAEGHVRNGENRLLNALQSVTPHPCLNSLELIPLQLSQELYSPNSAIEQVYFPVDGVVSMLAQLENGVLVEVATVGNEGMIGLPLFLGTNATPGSAFSQVPGDAYRLSAEEFKQQIEKPSRFTRVLHRYTQALMTQISQGNACNRVHNNRQRCARWLLLSHDRVGKDEFFLTQEFLSQMLSVRRATVNEIAGQLKKAGAIDYSRGVIQVLDRGRLESESCVCYAIIRDEYNRMYSDLQTQS
jgi:CRP-like cAMP-binding protein